MTAAAPQYQPRYPRARLSAAKDEVLAIEITRELVERCDIQPLLGKLELLSEDAPSGAGVRAEQPAPSASKMIAA
ncbi:hypothetical protein U5801_12240 [Lamprobacter modestohalophilus]|uniref:hypothetical protein n=1 Tax=Lamprobacter modestohalophilus TaxID=1064514 RepID=UPI002ADED271|nr:hypothetical protein [Lamprobacter modestohalophilus]MEA1050572.1 hypothetical protein [Lamprobacter modestohalophilus]